MATVTEKRILIDAIKINPVQPPWRATEKRLTDSELMMSIKDNGIIYPPFVACIDGSFTALDGHRRIKSWSILGHRDIKCKVISASTMTEASLFFIEINGTPLAMRGCDYFYVWASAPDRKAALRDMSKARKTRGTADHIRRMCEHFGEKTAIELGLQKTTPSIMSSVYTACAWLRDNLGSNAPLAREVGLWVIKHGGPSLVNKLNQRNDKRVARRVAECIHHDKPLAMR